MNRYEALHALGIAMAVIIGVAVSAAALDLLVQWARIRLAKWRARRHGGSA